ncbi:MAG: cytochrome ubiquinol oxidase subunit I, partial [Rhodococcus sp. (in: high G+C Gram-positive bacteria)]
MDALDVSRWQFGITTVYHFILVPLTIGLAPMVAAMQTMWVITGKDSWYRLTKFFGKLFLINFALGVATGIVQEFQFGMNWSEYSRFVGDVFGAPLALEGLVAFFLESTFLGLWIFGWSRLPKLVHLATIWLVAIGVNASAFFIIAANSWMQHPVGAIYNEETGRAELTDIWALLTNNTALAAFPHAVAGAFLVAGTFVAGICAWWMVRDPDNPDARSMHRPAAILGCLVAFVAAAGLAYTGDVQGKLMFQQQPMKMAS